MPTSNSSTTRFARAAATSRSTRSRPAAASASGASQRRRRGVMGEEHPAGAWTLRADPARDGRGSCSFETASRSPRPRARPRARGHRARRLPHRSPPPLAKARAPMDLLEPDLPPLRCQAPHAFLTRRRYSPEPRASATRAQIASWTPTFASGRSAPRSGRCAPRRRQLVEGLRPAVLDAVERGERARGRARAACRRSPRTPRG